MSFQDLRFGDGEDSGRHHSNRRSELNQNSPIINFLPQLPSPSSQHLQVSNLQHLQIQVQRSQSSPQRSEREREVDFIERMIKINEDFTQRMISQMLQHQKSHHNFTQRMNSQMLQQQKLHENFTQRMNSQMLQQQKLHENFTQRMNSQMLQQQKSHENFTQRMNSQMLQHQQSFAQRFMRPQENNKSRMIQVSEPSRPFWNQLEGQKPFQKKPQESKQKEENKKDKQEKKPKRPYKRIQHHIEKIKQSFKGVKPDQFNVRNSMIKEFSEELQINSNTLKKIVRKHFAAQKKQEKAN